MYSRLTEKILKTVRSVPIVSGAVFIVILVFLRAAFPPEKIRSIIANYAKNEFGREISFDKSSFRIIGVDLRNFALSRKGGFANGTFIKTEKLSFKAKLLPLLGKKIVLDYVGAEGLAADIVKEDGTSNRRFLKEAAPEKGGSGKIYFDSPDIEIKTSRIKYSGGEETPVFVFSDLSAFARNVHFGKPFETKVKFKFSADEDAGGQIFTEGLFIADLKNLNFAAASVDCRSFTLRRGKEKIFIKASVRDLLNPYIAFSAQGNSLTENLLKGLVPANIRFKFGEFKLNSEIDANPEEKSLNFKYLNFVSGKSMLKSKGVIRWGQEGIKFDFSQSLNVDIEEIFSILGISPAKARFSGSA